MRKFIRELCAVAVSVMPRARGLAFGNRVVLIELTVAVDTLWRKGKMYTIVYKCVRIYYTELRLLCKVLYVDVLIQFCVRMILVF